MSAKEKEPHVITDLLELAGWTVLELRRWKPGVVQVHARISWTGRRPARKMVAYAKDSVFAAVQLPP